MNSDRPYLPWILPGIIVLFAVIGVIIPLLIHAGDHRNYVRISECAEKYFYGEMAPVFEKCVRDGSGLRDVKPVFELRYNEKEDYDARGKKLNVAYVASYYTSDQMDRYYVERWDYENRLLPFFHRFGSGIQRGIERLDELQEELETDYGTVVFTRRWGYNPSHDHGIQVKTSAGRRYAYGYRTVGDGWSENVDIDSSLVAYESSSEKAAQAEQETAASGTKKGRAYGSTGKSGGSREIDPDDYDLEAFYEDYRDEFEDEDDAWEAFLEDEGAWDDY